MQKVLHSLARLQEAIRSVRSVPSGVGCPQLGDAGDAVVSEEIKEYVAGDKITITTTIEHEANIAGIVVSYHSEDAPHASYGALTLSQGSTDISRSSPWDQSVSLPGPYLEGEVTLETSVSPMQRPGTYRLESIRLLTAGHKQIFVQEIPEDRIRILPEPTHPPHIDRWEVRGESEA
jgi:hypothetical protein